MNAISGSVINAIAFIIMIIIILFAISSIKNLLFWTKIWQIKEYRWDRMKDFFHTPEGRETFYNKSTRLQFTCLAIGGGIGLIMMDGGSAFFAKTSFLILILPFLIETHLFVKNILHKKLQKPEFTKRAIITFLGACIITSILWILSFKKMLMFGTVAWVICFWLLLLAGSSGIVGISILLNYPLSLYLKTRINKKAKNKMKEFKNLRVIGITGSYGKTSVKEYLYTVLQNHTNCLATEKHNNAEISIAQTINNKLRKGHDLFIVEMGAYRIGEIKRVCNIIPPNISILTGINEQHVGLFGSIENTITAKSEIIHGLQDEGIIILNYDNEYVKNIQIPKKYSTITYGIENKKVDLFGDKIKQEKERQTFELIYKRKKHLFTTQLLGKHNIQNLLAIIAAALTIGIQMKVIQKEIALIKAPTETLQIKQQGTLTIIDDSYNSNPSGVMSAIEILSTHKNKKIIVLDDILELGKEAERIHRDIAKKLHESKLDTIILVGKNYVNIIQEELKKLDSKSEIINNSFILKELKNLHTEKATILFEGMRSKQYLCHLESIYSLNNHNHNNSNGS